MQITESISKMHTHPKKPAGFHHKKPTGLRHRKLAIFCAVLCLLVLFCALDIYLSSSWLETSTYELSSDRISSPFRIVQLTDLHGSVFGDENSKLIESVADCDPDIILITGDLINYKSDEVEEEIVRAENLISALAEIAPVYVSYGNHEVEYDEKFTVAELGVDTDADTTVEFSANSDTDMIEESETTGSDTANDNQTQTLATRYSAAGAIVLDGAYLDTEINGTPVRIGGIYGYCQVEYYAAETDREDEAEFLRDFEDTDRYKILMCHMPVCWLAGNSLYDWDVDCVFAGHAHGGQVQIPFIGGLYAPDQGFFPGREYGIYRTTEENFDEYHTWLEDTVAGQEASDSDIWDISRQLDMTYREHILVLSRGLGNTDWLPRFNNRPEVVCVEFEN